MASNDVPIARARYGSSDPSEAREFMSVLYGADLEVGAVHDREWSMSFDQVSVGSVVAVHLDMPADLRFQLAGRDEFVITTMLGGTAEFERPGGRERYGTGDVYLAIDPLSDGPCHCDHAHAYTVSLPSALMHEVAASAGAEVPTAWSFLSHQPLAGTDRRWIRGLRMFRETIDGTGPSASPLVVGAATRLLAALALEAFPNTALTSVVSSPGGDSGRHPETLRRAVAFIESCPDQDITLADIAAAARVTPRAIQATFRRHLDTTPLAYLRRVRLRHAHDELARAAGGDDLTVTEVAQRWGYANAGRFAADHRAEYGVVPSHTLHA